MLKPIGAELRDCCSLVVGVQPGRGREQTAGVDLWELFGVADEDQTSTAGVDVVEKSGEGARADHRGFVDDDHRAVVQSCWPSGARVDLVCDVAKTSGHLSQDIPDKVRSCAGLGRCVRVDGMGLFPLTCG